MRHLRFLEKSLSRVSPKISSFFLLPFFAIQEVIVTVKMIAVKVK